MWTAHILVNTRVCACSTDLGQNIPQSKESFEHFKREKFKGHGKVVEFEELKRVLCVVKSGNYPLTPPLTFWTSTPHTTSFLQQIVRLGEGHFPESSADIIIRFFIKWRENCWQILFIFAGFLYNETECYHWNDGEFIILIFKII